MHLPYNPSLQPPQCTFLVIKEDRIECLKGQASSYLEGELKFYVIFDSKRISIFFHLLIHSLFPYAFTEHPHYVGIEINTVPAPQKLAA